jgi:hypothetical protein
MVARPIGRDGSRISKFSCNRPTLQVPKLPSWRVRWRTESLILQRKQLTIAQSFAARERQFDLVRLSFNDPQLVFLPANAQIHEVLMTQYANLWMNHFMTM